MSARLSLPEAVAYVAASGFRAGPVGQVGVELEWLVRDPADPSGRPTPTRLHQVCGALPSPLPGGGRLSLEPGGQLELSSAPAPTLSDCVAATTGDLALLRTTVNLAGLSLEGVGLDPLRPPQRIVEAPRYAALESYYDQFGPDGRMVMCNSASVQVCLDAGDESAGTDGYRFRWRLADLLGPVLLAAFANSPGRSAYGVRLRSTRQIHRFATEPSRTRTPARGGDPRQAWARYALGARVACVARPGRPWLVGDGMTFADWLAGAGPRPAELADLELHLGTLVPPVRPRGYLEFRMIDAQPDDGWVVPAAVTAALLDDPIAARRVVAACEPLRSVRRHRVWLRAARRGLADPALAAAAAECFDAALAALDRASVPGEISARVARFADRYTMRGRCPADDAFTPLPTRRRKPLAAVPEPA